MGFAARLSSSPPFILLSAWLPPRNPEKAINNFLFIYSPHTHPALPCAWGVGEDSCGSAHSPFPNMSCS